MRKSLILGGIALLGVSSITGSASAQNLLVNPGFEAPVTYDGGPFIGSWEAFSGVTTNPVVGTATSANSTVTPRSGLQDLELIITGANNSFAGAFQDVPVTPGALATFSGFHQTTTAVLGVASEYRIEWRNSAALGTEISRVQLINSPILGQYTAFSVSGNAPLTANIARLVYAIQTFGGEPNPGDTGTVHVDDVSFVVAPEPTSIAALAGASVLLRRRRR